MKFFCLFMLVCTFVKACDIDEERANQPFQPTQTKIQQTQNVSLSYPDEEHEYQPLLQGAVQFQHHQNIVDTTALWDKRFLCSAFFAIFPASVFTCLKAAPWSAIEFQKSLCEDVNRQFDPNWNGTNCDIPQGFPCADEIRSIAPTYCNMDLAGNYGLIATASLAAIPAAWFVGRGIRHFYKKCTKPAPNTSN